MEESFFLPFRTTFETDSLSQQAQEKVFQKSVNPSGKHFLYLKYSEATSEVLSLLVWYRVRRQIQLDANRYIYFFKKTRHNKYYPDHMHKPVLLIRQFFIAFSFRSSWKSHTLEQ